MKRQSARLLKSLALVVKRSINRVKQLPEEDLEKNAKGVTVVKRSGLIKLEEIYKKTIFDDEPIDEETKQRELLEILVDEKNSEIARLYAQLKAKDEQLSNMDCRLRVKDVQIAERTKQIDPQQQLALTAMRQGRACAGTHEAKVGVDRAKAQVGRNPDQTRRSFKKGFFGRLFGK